MRRNWIVALAAMAMGMSTVASAADTEKAMTDIAAKAKNSLAIMTLKVKEANDSVVAGQAICIDSSGIFVTTFLDQALRADMISDLKLVLPGKDARTIKAKFLAVDPSTGLGFIQAEEKFDWTPVEFVQDPKLAPGQLVISMGIMGGDGNHTTYLGAAYVSAVLRVPGQMVYVTGGKLTNVCSPVFAADGRAMGIVVRQLPLSYQTDTPNGPVGLVLRGEEETSFFLPSDEFYHAVRKEGIPKENEIRRLTWIGVNKFEPVTEENAKVRKIELPAIMVDQVIPNEPADKAGMKNADIILEIDGQKFEKMANPGFVVQNFVRQLVKYPINKQVKFKILRGAETKELTVTIGTMPTLPNEASRLFDQALGLLIREKVALDSYLLQGPLATESGLVVLMVQPKSPAADKGIAANDLITAVNDQAVKTRDQYKTFTEAALKQGSVKLTYYHGDSKQPVSATFTVPPPAPR